MVVVSALFIAFVASLIRIKKPIFACPIGTDGFRKDETDALRGILAVCILLSHMTSRVDYQLPVVRFSVWAPIGVAVFFFLSGYSLAKSSIQKGNYFRGFIKKRVVKTLIPYIVFVVFYGFVSCLLLHKSPSDFMAAFASGNPVSNSWYVIAILFFYLAFYVCFFKTDTSNRKQVALSLSFFAVITAIYVYITHKLLAFPDFWYKTCPMMAIGIFFAYFEKTITRFINRRYFLAPWNLCYLCYTGICFSGALEQALF